MNGSTAAIGPGSSRPQEVELYVQELLACYVRLSGLSDLRPGPIVNDAFDRLVRLCRHNIPAETINIILGDPRIQTVVGPVQELCFKGEFQLEEEFAKLISDCESVQQAKDVLRTFPYSSCYEDLVRLELNTLAAVSSVALEPQVLFIGSGPLPLTSLWLVELYRQSFGRQMSCSNMDKDPHAFKLGRAVCAALGELSIGFQCAEIGRSEDLCLDSFDIVFLAAMVGETTAAKRKLLCWLAARIRIGTMVVVRSASGLKTILYPSLDLGTDIVGLEPVVSVSPRTKVINDIVIYRKL